MLERLASGALFDPWLVLLEDVGFVEVRRGQSRRNPEQRGDKSRSQLHLEHLKRPNNNI